MAVDAIYPCDQINYSLLRMLWWFPTMRNILPAQYQEIEETADIFLFFADFFST